MESNKANIDFFDDVNNNSEINQDNSEKINNNIKEEE